jgi:hypothetical protein
MRKVLIVSPRFPPVSAPDLHRVRMSLPYFAKYGWEPTVLCTTAESSDGVLDPELAATIPHGVRIERVAAWPQRVCRRFGFGHFNYRCLLPLYRRGSQLLASERFDLVYFSTTAALTFLLGRLWRRRFQCPVVLDYQDPWHAGLRDAYDRSTAPGGMFKYTMSRWIGRMLEPVALRAASQLIAVSPQYIDALREHYPWLEAVDAAVIPFGAPFEDFERLAPGGVANNLFDPRDGCMHWVYVGVVAPHMWPVIEALFAAIAAMRRERPHEWARVRLHFVGTSYAHQDATAHVARIAREMGIAELVAERTQRVPYMQALRILHDSHGIMVVGSLLGDYTPSKMFLCALSGRPVLALMNAGSSVLPIAMACPNVRVAAFRDTPHTAEYRARLVPAVAWLMQAAARPDTDARAALREHSAEALTRLQCQFFDRLFAPAKGA